jgi:ABC-type sulfate transport system permease subunit
MKTKILMILCAGLIGFGGINNTRASEDNSVQVIGDVVVARPGCFLATIFGTALFIVALPIAAASGSVKETANTLVVHPAQATFTRPLGDFSSLN